MHATSVAGKSTIGTRKNEAIPTELKFNMPKPRLKTKIARPVFFLGPIWKYTAKLKDCILFMYCASRQFCCCLVCI